MRLIFLLASIAIADAAYSGTRLVVPDSSAFLAAKDAGLSLVDNDEMIAAGREISAVHLAIAMTGECYRGDNDCAIRAVSVTVVTRVLQVMESGRVVTVQDILDTPMQYPGYVAARRLPVSTLEEGVLSFLEIARKVMYGSLGESFPPATHYALGPALKKTKWGRMALADGVGVHKLSDGHWILNAVLKIRPPELLNDECEHCRGPP